VLQEIMQRARWCGGSAEARQLVLYHHTQRRQVDLHCIPHMLRSNVLIIMAVDVARPGHVLPCNRRVPRLQRVRQTA
jgi:hypothetical protein